jgi:hypothetical protein
VIIKKKFGVITLILAILLVGMALIPAVSADTSCECRYQL